MSKVRYMTGVLIVFLLLAAGARHASASEHPGILNKDADCSSCHADKTRGRSVHSAMAMPCIVCHLARTQGDMTTLNLAMPKQQICSACHQTSTELLKHTPVVKGQCVDCHDAHRSSRRSLLREQAECLRRSSGSHHSARKTPAERAAPGHAQEHAEGARQSDRAGRPPARDAEHGGNEPKPADAETPLHCGLR